MNIKFVSYFLFEFQIDFGDAKKLNDQAYDEEEVQPEAQEEEGF